MPARARPLLPALGPAAALAALMLAGCLGSGTEPPGGQGQDGFLASSEARLLCLPVEGGQEGGEQDGEQGEEQDGEQGGEGAGLCNFESTVSPQARQANELSIAVNPLDPMNIIASGKDYTPEEAGDCVWDGIYTTKDGGRTWTNQNVPGSPWKRLADPASAAMPPPDTSRFWCATDPVVAFGPDGTAYWTVMPYQCDPVSGSKTGRGVLPQGGFNDWFWTCSSMYVLVSTDGGMTWPVERMREVAFGPRLEHDKQWLSVAPDGRVLLCWDRSPAAPDATGSAQPPLPATGSFGVVCAVSADRGDTWSDWRYMTQQAALPWVDFGPDGTAWAVLITGSEVVVTSSPDGLAWGPLVPVGSYQNPPPGGEYGWPVLRGSDFRMFTVPSLAVDRSEGPYSGRVYAVWFDHSEGEGNILLSWSDDGQAWSAPRRVHDDAPEAMADQFMPAVGVGPDGTVDVVWMDRRDDPDNHLFTAYHTYSLDGAQTFAPNLRVGTELSDEQFSHHQNGMVFLGDYIDIDSVAGQASMVWPDTRHGRADAFVATVLRPGANGASG